MGKRRDEVLSNPRTARLRYFFKCSKTRGTKVRSRCLTVSGGTPETTGGTPVPPMVSETRPEDLSRPFTGTRLRADRAFSKKLWPHDWKSKMHKYLQTNEADV